MLTNHFIPNMSNKNDGLEMMFLWSSGLLHLNKKLLSISSENVLVPWAGVILDEIQIYREGLDIPWKLMQKEESKVFQFYGKWSSLIEITFILPLTYIPDLKCGILCNFLRPDFNS